MSTKQKTISGYRQKMRKYLQWAKNNAPELYEEVWGQLEKYGAKTPDDLTMVPPEVLIHAHDELGKQFQQFVQNREEEKWKEVVATVSNPEPVTAEEPELQREQVEARATALLSRIEDDAASNDVPEEVLTALLVNDWAKITVQALSSMVDVAERSLDEASRKAKALKAKEREDQMRALAEEDRTAGTEQVSRVTPPPSVQTEEVPEVIVPVIPSSPTPTAGVVKEKPRQPKRKFIPRSEWSDCPNPHDLPNCMGKRAPLRDRSGFYEICASCHQYQQELELAVPAVVEEDGQGESLKALELKAEALGLLTSGVKGYVTKLLKDETKGVRAAIDYLTGKVEPEVEESLQLVETKAVEVETPIVNEELRLCWHCVKNKPAHSFVVFEDRYPWLPKGHDILNWVEKEICGDCVSNLDRTARKLADASKGDNKCPRCKEFVSRVDRKCFAIRRPIPKDHPIRKEWEGKRLCWECINELAREVYEISQGLAAKVPDSSPTMSEGAWVALLKSEEKLQGPIIDEPLVDKSEAAVRQPQRVTKGVTTGAVA